MVLRDALHHMAGHDVVLAEGRVGTILFTSPGIEERGGLARLQRGSHLFPGEVFNEDRASLGEGG